MVLLKKNRLNLKKKDIIRNIFLKVGLSSLYSSKIVNDIIKILISDLKLNKKIIIKNFGSFSLVKKKKRIGRNPKSQKIHFISERVVTIFKASDFLKKKINKNV
jgi:nucleoid DNA-binding protein